jgi:hypothetical protein
MKDSQLNTLRINRLVCFSITIGFKAVKRICRNASVDIDKRQTGRMSVYCFLAEKELEAVAKAVDAIRFI